MIEDPRDSKMDLSCLGLPRSSVNPQMSGAFQSKRPLHDASVRLSESLKGHRASQQRKQQSAKAKNDASESKSADARPHKSSSTRTTPGQPPKAAFSPTKVQMSLDTPNERKASLAMMRQGQNKRLSFSEEDEDGEENGSTISFSLAESTRKRFQTERRHMPAMDTTAQLHAQLLEPRQQAQHKTFGPIVCGAAQARGGRPYMEDRQTFISAYTPLSFTSQPLPDDIARTFAAVYDGHNGAMAAEYASSRLHMLLAQDPALRWTTAGPGTVQSCSPLAETESRDARACAEVEAAIRSAFFAIDGEILEKSRADDARDGAAALVVLRMGNMLWTAHAGDSRAVLCRDGKAVRLTEDHKPELEREKARVEANGGHVDFQRCWRVICPADKDRKASGLSMSRSLGDINFKEPRRFVECEPDVGRVRASEQDSFIVMASDGLWDVITDEDAVTIVKEKMAANASKGHTKGALDVRTKEAAQLLVDTALNKGSLDNITVLILHFQWF